METKKCSKCGEEKPLSEFHRNRTKKYGVQNECKCCVLQGTSGSSDSAKIHRLRGLLDYYKNRTLRLAASKKRYCADIELSRQKALDSYYRRREVLSDSYVKQMLRQIGFNNSDITPDLIELKRAELKLKRAIKEKTNERS